MGHLVKIFLVLFLISTTPHAQLKLKAGPRPTMSPFLIDQANFDGKNRLLVLGSGLRNLAVRSGIVSTSLVDFELPVQDESHIQASVDSEVLVYPNPFRASKIQEDDPAIGYKLSKAMDIEILIYDMAANLIFEQEIKSGSEAAQANYNKFKLGILSGVKLTAGVYFYFIRHKGEIMGQGKMAVVP